MQVSIEIYRDIQTREKMIFVACDDGASGAEYKYETAEDIGKAVTEYLKNYYPDMVKDPDE